MTLKKYIIFLESITPREILDAWKPTLKYCINPARNEGTKIKSLSKRKNIITIKTATIIRKYIDNVS